jgi:putative transposase
MLLVYRYRVKSLTGLLNSQARACNFVWNFCNDTQKHALKWNKRWPTGFDLNRLTAGSSKELALHAGTINAVCEQYAKSRRQTNRPFLRWRGRRSLGWVPLKGRDLKRVSHDRDINSALNILFRSGHRTPAEGIPVH